MTSTCRSSRPTYRRSGRMSAIGLTPDRDGLWMNKFLPDHIGPIDEVTWVADDHSRYLNPEIVLLFKARKRRTKDERDFARVWPMLAKGKQDWLREMIRKVRSAEG